MTAIVVPRNLAETIINTDLKMGCVLEPNAIELGKYCEVRNVGRKIV
jgi:hypothetical protein